VSSRLRFPVASAHGVDLNTQPSEATYQLLSSPFTPLHPKVVEEVNASRLIHISVEAIGQSIPGGGEDESDAAGQTEPEKDDEGELPDHDERSIAKTRPPREGDGMLEVEELVKLMQEILPSGATSTLASSSADQVPAGGSAGNTPSGTDTFGTRGGLEGMSGVGKDEPAYTCYTPLFKLTLGTSCRATRSAADVKITYSCYRL
jgi:RNA exonuclease NGL2